MRRYRYYLAIQTLLPADYRKDPEFAADLGALEKLGFDGVELNIRDPESIDPEDLKSFLGGFGLGLSMFATGGTAKALNLSLAAADEAARREAVRRTEGFLEFASRFGAGIIAGFLKGPLAHNTEEHRLQLRKSIAELAPTAARLKTPFQIEAINRFESPLGRSLDEAWDLVGEAANEYTWILPDTWHMNIEESNMEAAMVRYRGRYGSFHLSDNNRFFPGFGAIDFKRVVGVLDACGYAGKLAIEGNVRGSFREDVEISMRFLDPILR